MALGLENPNDADIMVVSGVPHGRKDGPWPLNPTG
jgi:hypothetical protein